MPEQCLIVSVRVAIRGSVSGTPSSPGGTAPAKSTLVSLPDQLRLPPPQARGTAAAHIAKSATARALLLFVVSARETRFVPRLQRDELPHCQGWGVACPAAHPPAGPRALAAAGQTRALLV